VEETVRLEEIRMKTAQENNKSETTKAVQKMKEEMKRNRYNGWKQKPLHGQYIRQLEENVDIERTFQWLRRSDFTIEAEGFVTAAQDQAIQTRSIAKNLYHTATSYKCRMCNKHVESISHILAECPFIAQTLYMERHNRVAAFIHWKLCKINAFETESDGWTQHTPSKIMENSHIKILWDCNIFTDYKISARRPDIVVMNKTTHTGTIIDINCPNDRNVCANEIKKMHKYTELKIEVERIWKIHFEIVPIVIGCLGAVSKSLPYHLKRIGLNSRDIITLQDITLSSSCHILRMCVTQSGIPL
jgi:DNA-directed RNA polymerase subunit RPC12/RpoP